MRSLNLNPSSLTSVKSLGLAMCVVAGAGFPWSFDGSGSRGTRQESHPGYRLDQSNLIATV